MRVRYLGLGLLLWVAGAAQAMEPTPKMPPLDRLMPGKSVNATPMAAWEVKEAQGMRIHTAEGKDAVANAPRNAVRYEIKNFVFPTGTMRVLKFKKADGGVLHPIGGEKELFVINGRADVTVAGAAAAIATGDAVYLPNGVLRGTEDATILAFTVGTLVKDPKGSVVHLKDATHRQTAQWIEDGKPHSVTTPQEVASAPAGAGKNFATVYEFDGNSIRYVNLKKGGIFDVVPAAPKVDNILYIASGHMRFMQGEDVTEVYEGDAIREVTGIPHSWEMVEEGVFIATTAPGRPKL
jgi:quercetin dioxygenase-like cupin family protein